MDFLIELISENNKLPLKTINNLNKLFTVRTAKKRRILTRRGETPEEFFIIKQGVVRSYFHDKKGRQVIQSLYGANSATGDFSALIENRPSKITYDCLTDCEMYVADFVEFKKLLKKDAHLNAYYHKILEASFVNMEERIYELSMLDATELYLKIRKDLPEIEKQIAQYHIASYLNITPIQLSRVRRSLNIKKKGI
ncbi:Crp/Fnr family transcriptional regulator [Polaribacter sp. HL-MS24]|uniref:Crp/Fnr family transcriptional regulator n=1 Tax=Polaribacter sp. HL-MS24 TaxID=3077735 RepID=UPI0029352FCA|nr:Crp/Fnr family transcriptional regulator [Polaribacter sp. HL-MS24]WOC40621.1 Crp/Fnr family transcriptional regulator [Polaribacter sp. HL-MS24]